MGDARRLRLAMLAFETKATIFPVLRYPEPPPAFLLAQLSAIAHRMIWYGNDLAIQGPVIL